MKQKRRPHLPMDFEFSCPFLNHSNFIVLVVVVVALLSCSSGSLYMAFCNMIAEVSHELFNEQLILASVDVGEF